MSELAADLSDPATIGKLRDAAKQMGARSIQDGSWFRKTIAAHVKAHAEKVTPAHFERVYPGVELEQRAQFEIRRVALKSAGAGVLASAAASTGELLALFTEGLAAPIGIPATMLAMVLEAIYTSLLQIDLACDLGVMYGIPFNPDDVGEIATLFGLALEIDVYSKKEKRAAAEDDEKPKGLTERLLHMEEGEIATRIGRKLLEDAIMRNILPIVSLPISARWNFVATSKLGAKVGKYMRYRRAMRIAIKQLQLGTVVDPTLLLEGAWLLSTVDGEAGHMEMLALAAVMDLLTPEQRQAIATDRAFGDDEEAWFKEIAVVDRAMHAPLLDTLYLIAAADQELAIPERRFLRRIGNALSCPIDFPRVELICRHLHEGEPPPVVAWG